MLTPNQINFMTKLRDGYVDTGGWALCTSNPPSPAIQRLVDGGYCKLSKARSGPLGLDTGEVMVGLTDAGRTALAAETASTAT